MKLNSLFLCLLFAANSNSAPVEVETTAADTTTNERGYYSNWDKLTKEIEANRKAWETPGLAVGVVRKGKLVYAKGFGTKNEKKEAVTPETLFQIGSTTKAFNAFAVAKAIDEGFLNWDTPVTSIYPVKFHEQYTNDHVNMIDLLAHRVGFGGMGHWNENSVFLHKTADSLLSKVQYLKPTEQFRAVNQYSNVMYVLAGEAAAKAAGTTWEALVQTRILNPLGMKSTLTGPIGMPATKNHARGYFKDYDGITKVLSYNDSYVTDSCKPAGSIVTNIEDLAKWVAMFTKQGALANGTQHLSPAQFSKLITPHSTMGVPVSGEPITLQTYGLGWFIESFRGKVKVHHSGGAPGYTSQIDFYPNDALGVIVLSNQNQNMGASSITNMIADRIMFPSIKSDWTKTGKDNIAMITEAVNAQIAAMIAARQLNTVPSLPFSAYEGVYNHPGLGNITFTLTDKVKNLFGMKWSGDGKAQLIGGVGHWEKETFGLFELPLQAYKNYSVPHTTFTFSKDGKQLSVATTYLHEEPVPFNRI
ncbi:beta-lactamase/transpeptidase-like protein [Obelidium mucronatum]|nr:beta-lactamase/transpeptidase-like protein [Obelidium mucronatum]